MYQEHEKEHLESCCTVAPPPNWGLQPVNTCECLDLALNVNTCECLDIASAWRLHSTFAPCSCYVVAIIPAEVMHFCAPPDVLVICAGRCA